MSGKKRREEITREELTIYRKKLYSACIVHTLRVEITLVRVEITVVSVAITFVLVKITLRVEITLCVYKSHSACVSRNLRV
jgi:hypothetical protein